MIRPTKRHIVSHGVSLVLLLLLVIMAPEMRMLWLIVFGLIVAASCVDFFAILIIRAPALALQLPSRVYLGAKNAGSAHLRELPVWIDIQGSVSIDFEGAVKRATDLLWQSNNGEDITTTWPIEPWRRGAATVTSITLRYRTPLGLFERRKKVPTDGYQTNVVANLDAVQRLASQSSSVQSYLQGLKVIQHVGDGQAFDALRVFQPGHDSRAIDWSVSARMRELHVREFREERNHNLVIAYDTGRLMARAIQNTPRLDIAINASLHLAYAAFRLSDKVGIFGFDQEQRVWSAPTAGIETLSHLTREAQKLPYTLNVTDFKTGCTTLSAHLKRRSIIMLITDVEGRADANALLQAATILGRRHLLYIVLLGDQSAQSSLPQASVDAVPAALAEANLVRERAQTIRTLAARGIHTIDTTPDSIVKDLLQSYYDIKKRGLL